LLLNSALEYAFRRVQAQHDGLNLNGKHQRLVYAGGVNILGGSVHTIKKNTEALVVASKESGLEVNADKTEYMVVSRDQNSGRIRSMKIDNNSFERVEQFKYLGTTLTNQNFIQEEIKSRLKSGNACYLSVQNLLFSSFLSKILKIKIHRIILLHVILYGCETWSLTLRDERRLRVLENRVLRRVFGHKGEEITGEWRKIHNDELNYLYSSSNIVRVIKLRRMRWAGHVAQMGREEVYAGFWWGNLRQRDRLEDPGVNGRIMLR